jgi:transcriptional regulator with XRE-family HTH domain
VGFDEKALADWMEARGYTAKQFAADARISPQYLGDILAGRRKLKRRPDLVKTFAELLQIPVTYLRRPTAGVGADG